VADITIVKQITTLHNDIVTNSIVLQTKSTKLVVAAPGPQGAPGRDGSSGSAFDFVQASPSASWSINHGLNKFPSVSVADAGGHLVYPDVSYSDLNNVAVVYPAPATGSAHLV
jgi:hypothetical protein